MYMMPGEFAERVVTGMIKSYDHCYRDEYVD
jgi:hypothetical protein